MPKARDPKTNARVFIRLDHHMVHQEKMFTISDIDTEVDIAAPKYWLIRTPDSSTRAHVKIAVTADNPAVVELFENPTITADGTELTPVNNDFNSQIAPETDFFYDPAVTADGARKDVKYIGTYNVRIFLGGTTRQQAEFILKQNEEYLVKATVEVNDTQVTLGVEFYELTQ